MTEWDKFVIGVGKDILKFLKFVVRPFTDFYTIKTRPDFSNIFVRDNEDYIELAHNVRSETTGTDDIMEDISEWTMPRNPLGDRHSGIAEYIAQNDSYTTARGASLTREQLEDYYRSMLWPRGGVTVSSTSSSSTTSSTTCSSSSTTSSSTTTSSSSSLL